MPQIKKKTKEEIAAAEYKRLIELYKAANVDPTHLKINDCLIKKVAEVYACLENIKDLPTIIVDRNNPQNQQETPAGRARIKYMAQYSAAMQRLNKELLGSATDGDDDGLGDFE